MARFCPLFSGSSGNCYLVGSGKDNILIDIGKNAKTIERALTDLHISIDSIRAIFITHEHTDHIAGLSVFASRYKIDVYASAGTLQALEEKGCLNGKFECKVIDSKGAGAGDMHIIPFSTPHDSRESIGYKIFTPDGRVVAVATDLGEMTDEVRSCLAGSDLVVLESNHDTRMLENGSYPYYLKRRIASPTGHLCNGQCAHELPFLAQSGTTRFFLAHLSRENNHPDLAFQTALCALTSINLKQGVDFELFVAPPSNPKRVTVF